MFYQIKYEGGFFLKKKKTKGQMRDKIHPNNKIRSVSRDAA
jgi:predicted Rdx family selenoprotein